MVSLKLSLEQSQKEGESITTGTPKYSYPQRQKTKHIHDQVTHFGGVAEVACSFCKGLSA